MWAIDAETDLDDDPDITVKYHPYIPIYLGCRRFGSKLLAADGQTVLVTPLLPGPGSYLEQDAELMLAFEVLEDIMGDIERGRQARTQNMQSAAARGQVLG